MKSYNLYLESILNELSQGAINKAINKFVKDGIDKEEATNAVNSFNELTKTNKIKSVDIFSLSFADLKKQISDVGLKKTRREKEKIIKDNETEFIFENDKVVIVSPKTYASSCKYGSNTKWCTTFHSDIYWKDYYKKGIKMYYIIPKDGSDKVAVAVYPNGKLEMFNAADKPLKENVFEKILKSFNINFNIFKPLGNHEIFERRRLTDEDIIELASEFLKKELYISSTDDLFEDAKQKVYYHIKSEIDAYNKSLDGNFSNYDPTNFIRNQFKIWHNKIIEMLLSLVDNGVDGDDNYNKILLISYINNDENFDDEQIRKIGFVMLYDKNIKYLISYFKHWSMSFKDLLDFFEKWLNYNYHKDKKRFFNFYNDFIQNYEKIMNKKITDDEKKELKNLIDKVEKVEYGKSGHLKLDLNSIKYIVNKYL